jgi:hypothetical protein
MAVRAGPTLLRREIAMNFGLLPADQGEMGRSRED